jgi:hypothetical protein
LGALALSQVTRGDALAARGIFNVVPLAAEQFYAFLRRFEAGTCLLERGSHLPGMVFRDVPIVLRGPHLLLACLRSAFAASNLALYSAPRDFLDATDEAENVAGAVLSDQRVSMATSSWASEAPYGFRAALPVNGR